MWRRHEVVVLKAKLTNVALGVDLVPDLSKKSILVTVKTDTVVTLLRSIGRQSNGLGTFAIAVLDVDIVERGIRSLVDHSAGTFVIGRT